MGPFFVLRECVRPYARLGSMDELHRHLDKFERASDRLIVATERIDPDDPDPALVAIALAEAKRVRREGNLVLRQLAVIRDQLQA